MKQALFVAMLVALVSMAAADSLTVRLDGVGGKIQKTAFAVTNDGWSAWVFNATDQPTWRLGHTFGSVGNSNVTLLGAFSEKTDMWSAQVESGVAQQLGDVRLTGCVGATLPVFGQKASLYSPGLSFSLQAGKQVRAGFATTFSWPSGAKAVWNAGPEVVVKVSDRITAGYRVTPLGTGPQDSQFRLAASF